MHRCPTLTTEVRHIQIGHHDSALFHLLYIISINPLKEAGHLELLEEER